MQRFYPLYVGAMLENDSQEVGMAKLRLFDQPNDGFGSIEIGDNSFIVKGTDGNEIGLVTVRDIDGNPALFAKVIEFTNGTVTDQGGGVARVHINGGGGGGGGGGNTPTDITVATEATDTTCFVAFFTAATGDLEPKTNSGLTYNSATNELTATTFVGALTGTASGNALASHTHGNISNAGAIGSTANLPIITTTSGVLTAGSFGTGANTFCQGNDSRLSDARTPLSHVHGNITNEGAIGSTSGLPVVTTTSGVLTTGTLTGTGTVLVAATSPTLVTPALGTPSSGVLTNCTGTASGLTAGNVTTNANLTGPITSVGNATSIASDVALAGNPTTTTQATSDNSTRLATTAFVKTAIPAQFQIAIDTTTTGFKAPFHRVPYNCTITGWELTSGDGVTGDVVIDLWKDTYANYAPTVGDSIVGAGTKPSLSSANKAQWSSLTSWTTALAAGDYIGANVDSRTTVTVVTLVLFLTRT
jgi:hypothetical protein